MSQVPAIPDIEIRHEVARNSFLVTYRGDSDASAVAVEVLTEDNAQNRNEFHRTTALQSRLGHPGMPPIRHTGVTEGHYYRIRDWVEGAPVSGLFTTGPLPQDRLVSTGRALASTLAALHRRGMIHGEVYPDRTRIDSSGLIRFLDPGRGWPVTRPLPALERAAGMPYMPPEMETGAPARAESDVFCLGATLAALAAGRPAPASGMNHTFLRECTKHLSPAFRVLLRSMLDPDPAKRPEAHTVTDCLTRIDQLDAVLKLRSWKPETGASSFLGHHAYPLIGREKELSQLMTLWQRASRGKGASVTILGPKGSGRRRLVAELRRGVLNSGGSTVRHRLDATNDHPTLIVNLSHKGRQGQEADQPWLSVNFAQTGPVPDQYTIELGSLPEGDCVRLAESYLAAPLSKELQEELFARGPMLPKDLLHQLDAWCEEGVLRPLQSRWSFQPGDGVAVAKQKSARPASAVPESQHIQIDYKEALDTVVGLWSTSIVQDDPMVSALASYCKALKCERADLYQIVNDEAKYVCASSFGRHRLKKSLIDEVMLKMEPVSSGSTLLYPLQCGVTFCGFISFQWWDAAVPRFDAELYQMIGMAASPIALTLGQTQLEDRRLKRITSALEELLQATTEPADIMMRTAQSLRKSLEFDILSAWLLRDGELTKLFTHPQGEDENDGSGYEEELFRAPFEPRQLIKDEDLFLALPLSQGGDLLGGIIISRDPSIGFNETEQGWVSALSRIGESALRNAMMFGKETTSS